MANSQESRSSRELESLERIDAICIRFERAWQEDAKPRLEDYLEPGDTREQEPLLFELLLIELFYRQRRGESWEWTEYYHRFPDNQECLDAVAEQQSRYSNSSQDGGSENASGGSLVPDRVRYVGNYEILEEIARGGMGVVFKARQTRLNRLVALKMLLASSLATPASVRRFQHEARTAARLKHPNIVPIHEIGEFEGHPWYTMDLIPGVSLDGELRSGPLDARRAARLTRQIAETVQFAHENGVLHRDLKPANILQNEKDEPMVADFGLAKLNHDPTGERIETLTATGQVVGTPSYMSPEQAAGRLGDVTVRTDVWAIGGILYACLTGRPPFAAATTVDTLLQVMRHDPIEPRVSNPDVPKDLENICLKCLSKEPRHRYENAAELAADLQRFEEGRPVRARPVRAPVKVWRWSKRNPLTASLSMLSILLLLVGSVVSAAFAVNAQYRAKEAEEARGNLRIALGKAQAATTAATLANEKTQEALKNEQEALAQVKEAVHEMHWSVYKAKLFPIKSAWEKEDFGGLTQLLREVTPTTEQPDVRGWEWYFFQDQVERATQFLCELPGEDRWVQLEVNRDSTLLAMRRRLGKVDIVDSHTGRIAFTIPTSGQKMLAWHPNKDLLAIPTESNSVEVWDIGKQQRIWTAKTENDSTSMGRRGIAWDATGTRLALGGYRRIDLFTADGAFEKTISSIPAWTPFVAFHPEGKLLGFGGTSWVGMVEIDSGRRLWWDYESRVPVEGLEWSPDGNELAAIWAWPRYSIALYDRSGRKRSFARNNNQINCFAWNPDGKLILTGSAGQQLEEWEVESGQRGWTRTIHESAVQSLAWDHESQVIYSLDGKGRVQRTGRGPTNPPLNIWNAPDGEDDVTTQPEAIAELAWRPDDSGQIAIRSDRQVVLVDVKERRIIRRIRPGNLMTCVAWHPHESKLLTFDRNGSLKIWDANSGALIKSLSAMSYSFNRKAGWSSDGQKIFAGSGQTWRGKDSGFVETWDANTYAPLKKMGSRVPRMLVSWSPTGEQLAVIKSASDASLSLLDSESGQVLKTSEVFREHWQNQMIYRSDGQLISIGFDSGRVSILDAKDAKLLHSSNVGGQGVSSLNWSPDGSRLSAITNGKELVVLDGTNCEVLLQFDNLGEIAACGWNPSGKDFAVVSRYGMLTIWSSADWELEPLKGARWSQGTAE